MNSKTLYKILKELDIIPAEDLENALDLATNSKTELSEVLLDKDLISDENLGKVLAEGFGVRYINLSEQSISDEILQIIPEIVAKKQNSISFALNNNTLKLATSNPDNKEFQEFLKKKTGYTIEIYYSTPRDIENALNLYRQKLQQTFDQMLKTQIDAAGKNVKKDAPILKIVDTLIEYAQQNKASDIHIEPLDDSSLIRFRIDGVLHDVLHLPKNLHSQIITRIKVLAKLRTDEHMSAQDGKLKKKLENEELDVRVSIVPIVDGEKCVLRLLSARSRKFSLQDLGMNTADLEKVRKAYAQPNGMILSTGPTGSGKTTSIYAILKILNTREINIATIEDPVEYDVSGINQIQVNPKTNLTFADGLRSILRQDPNIIFVGEIRDKETASIAVNSAMTGHLVLSTLHTNDAATTLPRLIDMDIEPFLVSSTVNIIIAQRLVRKICNKCKTSTVIPRKILKQQLDEDMIQKYFGNEKEITLYKGKGCEICHKTGYVGRVGVFEVLVVSSAIKELITNSADAQTIKNKALEEGMTTMFEDGVTKAQNGITTIEEVLRVTA